MKLTSSCPSRWSAALRAAFCVALVAGAHVPVASAQTAVPQSTAAATPDNAILITVFLKHDQSRPLAELNAQLAKQGFYKAFPPEGMEVVSWHVVMNIGQVIVVRLPATRLRELNRVIEDTAWGPYTTDFHPTYDYKAVGMEQHERALR